MKTSEDRVLRVISGLKTDEEKRKGEEIKEERRD
jgi:hypothetical protein